MGIYPDCRACYSWLLCGKKLEPILSSHDMAPDKLPRLFIGLLATRSYDKMEM
jgi:hypothetical protein